MTPAAPNSFRTARRLSLVDGLFHAVMVGVSESYLGAFAVELGHRDLALALLATLPLLAGTVCQPLAGPIAALLGGRKRLVVVGAALQAASHVGLIAIALGGDTRLWTLMSVKIAFWMSGMVINPAWGAWMASVTRDTDRHRYFARRSGLVHLGLVVAFALGGLVLRGFDNRLELQQGFAVLFIAGFLARSLSVAALSRQPDPRGDRSAGAWLSMGRIAKAAGTSRWATAYYLAAVMCGAQIAVPFFTPYMLRTLSFDYGDFVTLTSVSILSKALTFPFCHTLASRWGLRSLMIAAGGGVALIPLLWSYFTSVPSLALAQVVSGASWAGFEYASFQLLLGSARPGCRLEFLSLANALSGGAQLLGAVLGSQLVERLGFEYPQVFLVSTAGRSLPFLLVLVYLAHATLPRRLPRLLVRVLSVRPTGGAVQKVIFPSNGGKADQPEEPAGRDRDSGTRG